MPNDASDNAPKSTAPQDGPEDGPAAAPKKTDGPVKAKSGGREARLAEALRANLRRRKAPAPSPEGGATDKKED